MGRDLTISPSCSVPKAALERSVTLHAMFLHILFFKNIAFLTKEWDDKLQTMSQYLRIPYSIGKLFSD